MCAISMDAKSVHNRYGRNIKNSFLLFLKLEMNKNKPERKQQKVTAKVRNKL